MADFRTELALQKAASGKTEVKTTMGTTNPLTAYVECNQHDGEDFAQTITRLAKANDAGLAGLYSLNRGQKPPSQKQALAKCDLEAAHERVLKTINAGHEPSATDYALHRQGHLSGAYDDE
ncbi:hypothetical protein HK15_01435 [Acetobacter orientalis]|uniref:Uncharacterized protein n=1 Tax=Acetobacter orientalis TaxID=146474 RepID=A0A252BFJ0_9PROT|nr:hypothetical protein [Acetobacter orientalis]OUJ03113.1 hypothetical protein HK15_01435 [Acetobacter orientalis]